MGKNDYRFEQADYHPGNFHVNPVSSFREKVPKNNNKKKKKQSKDNMFPKLRLGNMIIS
jgi:hypothetical protein